MQRLDCEGKWPDLFAIPGVERMIVEFLPWLQYRQWITECKSNREQAQLCSWRPSSYRDIDVQISIVKQNNMSAFQPMVPFIQNWSQLDPFLSSEMLDTALQHIPSKPLSRDVCKQSLAGVETYSRYLIFDVESQSLLINLAFETKNYPCLDWMLNTMQWSGCVEKKYDCDDELLTIVANSVTSGRLTFRYFFGTPRPIVKLQLSLMTTQERHEKFKTYGQDRLLAEILWLSEFEIEIGRRDGPAHQDFFYLGQLESALSIFGLPPITPQPAETFRFALWIKLQNVLKMSKESRYDMLNTVCSRYFPHLTIFLWNMFNKAQQQHLLPMLAKCSTSISDVMYKFAFTTLQFTDLFDACMTDWYNDAFEASSSQLLEFLLSKVPQHLNNITFPSPRYFASNNVRMVVLLWYTSKKQWFLFHIEELLSSACFFPNIRLIDFLCSHVEVQPSQCVKEQIIALAEKGCINTIQKLPMEGKMDMFDLCTAYTCALNVDTVRALFVNQAHVTLDTECFATCVQNNISVTTNEAVEKCIFFVKSGFITTNKLYNALRHDEIQQPFWDLLFASLYFDVDF